MGKDIFECQTLGRLMFVLPGQEEVKLGGQVAISLGLGGKMQCVLGKEGLRLWRGMK